MSEEAAAVIEPPKTEQPTRKPLVLTNGITGMIAGMSGNKKPETPPVQTEEKKPDSVAPTEQKKVETPPAQDDKEKNFATLRQAREAAEKERDELKQKYEASLREVETYKVRIDPEEVAKERQTYEEKMAALKKELQVAALWRDPDFQEKYDGGILARQREMIALAQAAGIDAATATQHIHQSWNPAKFDEWFAEMPEYQKQKFGILAREVEQLDRDRMGEIANADKKWQAKQEQQTRAQKEAETNQKKIFSTTAQDVIGELLATEGVAENEPLAEAIKTSVMRALPISEGHMTMKEVAKHVGLSAMLGHIAQAQHTELTELRAKLAEMEKELGEKKTFIEERAGSIPTPGNGVGAGAKSDEPYVPFYKRLRVAGT